MPAPDGLCPACRHAWDAHSVVTDPIAEGYPNHVQLGQCAHVINVYAVGVSQIICHCTAVPPWKRDGWKNAA